MSLGRTIDRLLGLVTWAKVTAATALAGRVGMVKTSAHTDDELQHWQPYGYQSCPQAGADVIPLSMGADASQRVAILVGDRRYTITLASGEVAIVDDLGQKVHLTRTGIVVEADAIKLGAGATLAAARATDPVGVDAAWDAWFALVATATATTKPLSSVALGTITSGSAKTEVE